MSIQSDLAVAHQDQRIALGHALAVRLVALWRQVDISNLDRRWAALAPLMTQQITNAQLVAADQAINYLTAMDKANNYTPAPVALVPRAFAGVMDDGREIAPALYGAVTNTKTLIGKGVAPSRAFESGAAFIALIGQGALNGLGRAADRTLSAGKGYTHYIRVVNGSGCSRCAILAGIYSAAEAFKRHTSCQCSTVPLPGRDSKIPAGLHDSPQSVFDALPASEQDRIFTKAGAEAIRNGADPVKVVNARRGAYGIQYATHHYIPANPATSRRLTPITIGRRADGSPLNVYATVEGKYRGEFRYTRTQSVRVMPEQLLKMAGDNPTRWRELLGRYGYLQ